VCLNPREHATLYTPAHAYVPLHVLLWRLYHRPMADGSWHKVQVSHDVIASFKVTKRRGRFVITEMFVVADKLAPSMLRTLPLTRVEDLANADLGYLEQARVKWAAGQPDPSLADLRSPTNAVRLGDSGETVRIVEATANLVTTGTIAATAQRPRLERPDGTDPDGFYQRVADAHRDITSRTPRVIEALADEANVPHGTARRWILEARRRGFLPPARRTRA
jgi:hypothetical protein